MPESESLYLTAATFLTNTWTHHWWVGPDYIQFSAHTALVFKASNIQVRWVFFCILQTKKWIVNHFIPVTPQLGKQRQDGESELEPQLHKTLPILCVLWYMHMSVCPCTSIRVNMGWLPLPFYASWPWGRAFHWTRTVLTRLDGYLLGPAGLCPPMLRLRTHAASHTKIWTQIHKLHWTISQLPRPYLNKGEKIKVLK